MIANGKANCKSRRLPRSVPAALVLRVVGLLAHASFYRDGEDDRHTFTAFTISVRPQLTTDAIPRTIDSEVADRNTGSPILLYDAHTTTK